MWFKITWYLVLIVIVIGMPVMGFALNTKVVHGHIPYIAGSKHPDMASSLHLDNIQISKVVYQELTSEAEQSWIRINAKKGEELYFQIGVPYLPSLREYQPSLALINPEIADDLGSDSDLRKDGVEFFHSATQFERTIFHERFTDTTSWVLLEQIVELSEAGDYYLVSFSPEAVSGKLWISIGRQESFGPGDLARLPFVISDVKSFHANGEDDNLGSSDANAERSREIIDPVPNDGNIPPSREIIDLVPNNSNTDPPSGTVNDLLLTDGSPSSSEGMMDGVADDSDEKGGEMIADAYLIGLGMMGIATLGIVIAWRKFR